jgi:hypothetical protein
MERNDTGVKPLCVSRKEEERNLTKSHSYIIIHHERACSGRKPTFENSSRRLQGVSWRLGKQDASEVDVVEVLQGADEH